MVARGARRRDRRRTGFFEPTFSGLLAEVVGPDDLQPANAVRSAATSAGEILGPVLAGLIIAAVSPGAAIAVDAATFAVSAACLAAMRVAERERPPAAPFLAELRDGWNAFVAKRWVWTFVAYFALANVMWASWSALGPVVADRSLALTVVLVSLPSTSRLVGTPRFRICWRRSRSWWQAARSR